MDCNGTESLLIKRNGLKWNGMDLNKKEMDCCGKEWILMESNRLLWKGMDCNLNLLCAVVGRDVMQNCNGKEWIITERNGLCC